MKLPHGTNSPGRTWRWGQHLLLSLLMITSASGLAVLLPASSASASGTPFTSTGSEQTYTVPPGVTSVTISAVGAPGGTGASGVAGGDGASVTATMPVSSGETLYVEVGGAGAGGCSYGIKAFNGGGFSQCGGGGGGGSDVRTCSITSAACANLTPDDRLVVAGGGGGGGRGGAAGGQGGAAVTGAGNGGSGCDFCTGVAGGFGGSGAPAGGSGAGTTDDPCPGGPGSLGQGGSAPSACDPVNFGGGGGGGYEGGGAGGDGACCGGGGGAGSSFWVSGATDTSMSEDTTGVPEVTITPTLTPNGSEVRAVVQVETSPAYAGDTVNISSSQLEASCGGTIFFETLQGGSTTAPNVSVDSITAVLDDDGNVTVVVEGAPCAAGSDLIEADLTVAPFITATTVLDVEPPQVTPTGVSANPSTEVETGNSPSSGQSDVYTVFYVETDPVYAEQPVQISSPQLDSRCGGGWRWEPGSGTAIDQASGTNVATGTLDDDGNATFVFKGASCAAGPSAVIADVEAGNHPTYVTTFTVTAPVPTLASVKAVGSVASHKAAKRHRHHKGSGGGGSGTGGTNPAMTVTASPNALVETGSGTQSGEATLNVVKSDDQGGTSGPPATTGSVAGGCCEITYTITVSNSGTAPISGVTVSDDLADNNINLYQDSFTAVGTGGAAGFTPAATGTPFVNIDDTVDLPAGSSITYTVVAGVDNQCTTLSNTVTLTPPVGSVISPTSNLSATDNDALGGCE